MDKNMVMKKVCAFGCCIVDDYSQESIIGSGSRQESERTCIFGCCRQAQ